MSIVLLVIGCFFVSSSAILVKLSVGIPSVVLAAYRLAFICVMLLPYVLLKCRHEYKNLSKKILLLNALSGVIFAIHLITFFEAVRYSGVAEANILMCTEIIFIALYESFFKHHKISLLGWVCLCIAMVAAVFVITGKSTAVIGAQDNMAQYMWGNFLALCAAFASAVYTLIGRSVRKVLSTPSYTLNLYFVSLVVCLAVALLQGEALFGYPRINIATAFGLALFCNLLGHNMYSLCLKHLKANFVGAMKLTAPVFGSILAFIIFKEVPSLQVVISSVVLLTSIAFYFWIEGKRKPAEK